MITIKLVLILLAVILFVLAGIGVPKDSRVNLVALGLALWALATFA